jgi:hypothetical protein
MPLQKSAGRSLPPQTSESNHLSYGGRKRRSSAGEILEKCRYSPYIEEVEGWPDSEAKETYLRDLKRLKVLMIHSKKLGYGGFAMGMIYGKLKNRYPEARIAFEKELEDLYTLGTGQR